MERTVNMIEGFVWIAIGVCFLISLLKPAQRRTKIIAAANFIVFGFSDFVEMCTGAWWRPWWLLGWKAACIVVMAIQLVGHIRRRRSVVSNRQSSIDNRQSQ